MRSVKSAVIVLAYAYHDFEPLDGPPPIAKTLGPEGTRRFPSKAPASSPRSSSSF